MLEPEDLSTSTLDSLSYDRFIDRVADRVVWQKTRFRDEISGWFYRLLADGVARRGWAREAMVDDIARLVEEKERRARWSLRAHARRGAYEARVTMARFRILLEEERYRPTEVPVRPDLRLLSRSTDKRASIVLLTCNRIGYLETTVASIHATTHPDSFELIAVDNGSTDGTAERLREMASQGLVTKLILRRKNHGTSPGFNCGFAYSDPATNFLIKLDSDIKILTPGWLDRFAMLFERHPDIGLLALHQVNSPHLMVAPVIQREDEPLIDWAWEVMGSACMTIPRPIFQQVGYFNEDFPDAYMPDDIDYHARVGRLQHEAYYTKNFVAYHRHDLDRRTYWAGQMRKRAGKKVNHAHFRKHVRRDYDAGHRSLRVHYSKYDNCQFPMNGNVIEID